jgi:hypothetical protein
MSEEILSAVKGGVVPRCRQISKKARSSSSSSSSSFSSTMTIGNNNIRHHSNRSEADCSVPSRERSQRTAGRRKLKLPVATLFPIEKDANNNNDNNNTNNKGLFCGGVLKPAVTFFGETLDDSVRRKIQADRTKADALIVIGTSLSVAPISKVIEYLPANIPRILINRTIVHISSSSSGGYINGSADGMAENDFRENYGFDAYLLGYCDDVTRALARKLFINNYYKSDRNEERIDKNKRQKTLGVVESLQSRYCGGLLTKVLQGQDGYWKASDWSEIKREIPPERVLLFPGAIPSNKHDKDTASEDVTYQEIVHCDGCTKRIEGVIKKCVNCFDFDLCSDCFPIVSKTHFDGTHRFNTESQAAWLKVCELVERDNLSSTKML